MHTRPPAPRGARLSTYSSVHVLHAALSVGMGLPGVLSTRPHRLVFLAAGDACLYAATLKYGDPAENWSPEMQ